MSDRTWQLPRHPWVMRMTWSELLFAHWPVDPEAIARLMPEGIEVDTLEGRGWVGVVPFLMSGVAPRGFPSIPVLGTFLELNVRTYVVRDGKPGVWFFSLDADSRVAVRVARKTFHLPYMDAEMELQRDPSGAIEYRSDRTHRGEPAARFDASYAVDDAPFRAQSGSLEHWLTARYCLYSADRRGRVYRGEIDHPPWELSRATCQLRCNTMGQAWGFDLTGRPHLLFAQPVDVRAWWATRCR